MWPFITCGRSLSVMISLHSKPDLEKENTTFILVLRKFPSVQFSTDLVVNFVASNEITWLRKDSTSTWV